MNVLWNVLYGAVRFRIVCIRFLCHHLCTLSLASFAHALIFYLTTSINALSVFPTSSLSAGYSKQVPVTFEIEPDVCDEIITDEEWLWQMLLNLLTNACKYTDKGEIHVRMSLCAEEALQRSPERRMENTASWKAASKLPKLSFPHRDSADTLVCEVIDTGKGRLFVVYY